METESPTRGAAGRDPAQREPSQREPMFNAPWPPVLLAALILLAYAVQSAGPDAALALRLGLSGARVRGGDLSGLITSLFVHLNWTHALGSAAFALAFGAPISRRMGAGAQGAMMFFVFYMACGIFSGLAFAANHWDSPQIVVGASGALAGCMGAASRLLGRPTGLAPFTSPTVLSMAGAWLVIKLVYGALLAGADLGISPLSWEAQLAGYAAGLLLIGPVLGLMGRA